MAREDDWREERRWDERRQDYRTADPSGGYDYDYDYRRTDRRDDDYPRTGYRAAREDAWLDERRRRGERSFAPRDERGHPYRPFGDTGPTAYGPYEDGAYRRNPAAYGYGEPFAAAPYGARSGYQPDRYTPNPREGRGEESRSFLDKARDEVARWFGDNGADRRRQWDEAQAGHRGRGPKSYKRSDARIQEDINDRLTEDPYLDATDIEVAVSNGDVTLTGLVLSREDKRRAERLAEEVSGVGDVQNNLRLRRFETGEERPAGEGRPAAGTF